MIDESFYWKKDLLKQANTLSKRKQQHRWLQASFARLEQTIMLGFYSIRKLNDASKLSDSTVNQQVQLSTYPWSGKIVTLMNCHKINQLYDLDSVATDSRDVLFLCHQIVHSYVFLPLFSENGSLSGILFNSDQYRHKLLFCLDLDWIIALFEQVGNDYPNEMRMTFNQKLQDYDVTAKMHTGGNWAT